MKYLWKCLPEDQKPHGHDWTIPGWHHQNGGMKLCSNGFHASRKILDAMGYVNPGWICKVSVKGSSDIGDDKQAWSDMKIVKRYHWTKEDSVKLAIYAAELVLHIYEKEYPKDNRPRKAIETAKTWLKNPCDETRDAAWAAAWAAEAAARAAARAAEAAGAAAWAAEAAARAAILQKIERKIKSILKGKE